jgi:hypothetical protein
VYPAEWRVYSGLGGRIQLECDVDGFPQPVLNWFRLSRLDNRRHLVTPDSKHVMASEGSKYYLTIRTLDREDLLANFTCEAINEIGTAGATVEVTGRPEPPTVNSPPESLCSDSYTLVFTTKSFSVLTHVEVRFRTLVSQEYRYKYIFCLVTTSRALNMKVL